MTNEFSDGNQSFMKIWGLIIKAAGITGALLVGRLVFEYLNLDVLSVTNLITAFIGGAIFSIAIIFAGILTDYKESDKISSEVATSIRSFYNDLDLTRIQDPLIVFRMKENTVTQMWCITKNFWNNVGNMKEMNRAIDPLNADICRLVDMSVAPNYVMKLQMELTILIGFTIGSKRLLKHHSFLLPTRFPNSLLPGLVSCYFL